MLVVRRKCFEIQFYYRTLGYIVVMFAIPFAILLTVNVLIMHTLHHSAKNRGNLIREQSTKRPVVTTLFLA